MDTDRIKRFLIVLFGLFLEAFSYYHFNYQNSLAEGGFMGIALLGKYIFDISPALTTLLLDFPLFILGLKVKGHKFFIYSLFAATAFSIFYDLCERFSPFVFDFSDSMILGSILSGLSTGFSIGLVLRYGTASGGEEVMALLLHKRFGLEIGTFFIISDLVVLICSLWYLPLLKVFYTMIAVIVSGVTITWTHRIGKKTLESKKWAHLSN
ncbi:YitT family protein [Thermoflavimicrobium daqui]|uniref:YitT family protein n=1 Tax=Thermoflavimicrobium daqui TaxID=2137476 RepID=A0A364K3Z9_9BACL|nr:YitT family protein [Thermoflavimicrobium daqui]RAL24093.1 hypothetical protein DL897_10385 [Thermoflavimicrobium daqui]